MRTAILVTILFCSMGLSGQVRILFDATKAETVANADWQIDADQFNLQFVNGLPVITNSVREANPQRHPNPPASGVTASTPETYWKGALSSWAIECVKYGYQVETLPAIGSRITYGDVTNDQDLKKYNIFVLCEPNIRFKPSESQAIKEFVLQGGSLFMVCNHYGSDRNNDGYDSPVIFNEMMGAEKPFGFTFDTISIWTNSNNAITAPDDPIIRGPFGVVDSMVLSAGTTIRLFPETNDKVQGKFYLRGQPQGNTNAIAVSSRYGYGKVFAIGDSSIPDDGTGDVNDVLYNGWTGDGNGSHGRLVMNATVWLATTEVKDITLLYSVKDVGCHGGNDGKIDLSPTGGNGNYSFLWADGQTTEDLIQVTAGTYTVTITSGVKTIVDSFVISQPEEIIPDITVTPVTCKGPGVIQTTVTGGTQPYVYFWWTGELTTSITVPEPGKHYLTITDNNGCMKTEEIMVQVSTDPPIARIEGQFTINCLLDSATLIVIAEEASAGILWHSAEFESDARSITLDNAGDIELTVTSALNGCVTRLNATVVEDRMPPSYTILADETISCFNPIAHAEIITDADSLIWIQNSVLLSHDSTVTTQVAGLLIAVALNTLNGCSVSDSIFITEDLDPPAIEIDTILPDTDHTGTGMARLLPKEQGSQYTYVWTNSQMQIISVSQEITNVPAGQYLCSVTAENGCKTIVTVVIENISKVQEWSITEPVIYPNPAYEEVFVEWPGSDIVEIRLINSPGQIILTAPVRPGQPVSLRDIKPGFYILEVRSGSRTSINSLIIIN